MKSWLAGLLLASQVCAQTPGPAPAPIPIGAALAMRHEYNEVAASIDTLVRLYSAERLERLTDAAATPGVELPDDTRLVLLIWADDEARVYLNGAPVGQTRLTPTRIEIPSFYLQPDNTLIAHCWDTDRVESGFMAGLYLEDAAGLRPILTTTEDQGWEVASGPQQGQAAQTIFYAHTQPDLPSAEVIWGPQLFGDVQLQVSFSAAAVTAARRNAPVAANLPRVQDRSMDFHASVARLASLQQRRRELATRLSAGSEPMDRYLRARQDLHLPGLSYTLGRARPLAEATDLAVEEAMSSWTRTLPMAQFQLVDQPERQLRGLGAATAAEPLPMASGALAVDRRSDYQAPQDRGPQDQGTVGRGGGTTGQGGGRAMVVSAAPSRAFVWRMSAVMAALVLWTGVHVWRGWRLWQGVHWNREAEQSA